MAKRAATDGTVTRATGGGDRPGRRRDEILAAAARIFYEKGYDATSIQDVADAVGILKGSLYYYIDSKEDLLFGVIEDAHRRSLERITEWEALEGDALVKLRAFITAHVLNNTHSMEHLGVFFRDFRSLSPERRALIIDERDLYDRFVRRLIRTGQREGVIAPEIDPKLATMAILGAMNWLTQWYRPDGPTSPERIAREIADLVLSGLASDDARSTERRRLGVLGDVARRRVPRRQAS